jgi:electron transfer flavoprotein alpha subunit
MVGWHSAKKIKSALAIITLAPGLLEPVAENASYNCPVVPAAYIAPLHEIMCQERRAKSVSSVDLSKAKRVVGVGRGLVAQHDLQMVHQLASVLGQKWAVHA